MVAQDGLLSPAHLCDVVGGRVLVRVCVQINPSVPTWPADSRETARSHLSVLSTSASDSLQRIIPRMTYNVSNGGT